MVFHHQAISGKSVCNSSFARVALSRFATKSYARNGTLSGKPCHCSKIFGTRRRKGSIHVKENSTRLFCDPNLSTTRTDRLNSTSTLDARSKLLAFVKRDIDTLAGIVRSTSEAVDTGTCSLQSTSATRSTAGTASTTNR